MRENSGRLRLQQPQEQHYLVLWVRNPLNSDMDYRTFNVRTGSFLCVRAYAYGAGYTDSEWAQHFWLGKTHKLFLWSWRSSNAGRRTHWMLSPTPVAPGAFFLAVFMSGPLHSVVVAFLSCTLWGSPSMCPYTRTCTSAGTVHRVRGLGLRPFSMTPPYRQPHSVFGGFVLPFRSDFLCHGLTMAEDNPHATRHSIATVILL